ncbi:uncharacterized protein M6B38_349795 [Iris pallida]|uniref:Uncharacterized protein n=1 Tax=Iris pallida TaxID=29817 RepID=A0AAX6GS96_IRIPA|nr:uncharacterized protein M6B38_349795 [Iris pallida]
MALDGGGNFVVDEQQGEGRERRLTGKEIEGSTGISGEEDTAGSIGGSRRLGDKGIKGSKEVGRKGIEGSTGVDGGKDMAGSLGGKATGMEASDAGTMAMSFDRRLRAWAGLVLISSLRCVLIGVGHRGNGCCGDIVSGISDTEYVLLWIICMDT